MAKAIIRFGIKGEKHASRILSIKDAAQMAEAMDVVHGSSRESLPNWTPATAKFFSVSRRRPRAGVECPNGFWVEVEYVPTGALLSGA